MSDIVTPNTIREHLVPVEPEFAISESGQINWKAALMDYDTALYYRGKTISPEEYNTLFLKQAYQSNYTADSLKVLLTRHLPTIIQRQVQSKFNLRNSFVKIFTPQDWGELQEDGCYYINVPASEHGYATTDDYDTTQRLNIDTELYFLNEQGDFYSVEQVEVASNNDVRIYTDVPTVSGFLVVKANDKAYTLVSAVLPATQVEGLATVALSGDYLDLANRPDATIQAGLRSIESIIEGITVVGKATLADKANEAFALLNTSTIQNILVSDIFETGTRRVKDAISAEKDSDGNTINTTYAKQNGSYPGMSVKFSDIADMADIAQKDSLGNIIHVTYAQQNGTYANMTVGNATKAISANSATVADKATKDANGNVISQTYTTGLIMEPITPSVQLRVSKYAAPTVAQTFDLFRDNPTSFTMYGHSVRNIGGTHRQIVTCNAVRDIQVGSPRYDYSYLLLNLPTGYTYPRAIKLISDNYHDGVVPNYAIYQTQLTVSGTVFGRYKLFDAGYDFTDGANVVIEFIF